MSFKTIACNSNIVLKSGRYHVFNCSPDEKARILYNTVFSVNFELLPLSGVEIRADTVQVVINSLDANIMYKRIDDADDFDTDIDDDDNNTVRDILKGKIIALDAGHGGKDPGAVNHTLGINEKDLTLSIVNILFDKLLQDGASVFLTRGNDIYVGLSERATKANAGNADIFVSVHINSAESVSASGYEVLVYSEKGFANMLAENIISGIKKEFPALPNRGIKVRPELTVLAKTKMPAVLVECGFISNDKEAAMMNNKENQIIYADAIYDGIVKYFESKVSIDQANYW